MNILRLKFFIAVAETGSFSEAAEQLYTTQSSVSKQVMALEKELNIRLFDRTSRKTELTPQGKTALTHAKTIMADYEAMMAELSSSGAGTLCLLSIPVMAQYGITGILADFRQRYPHLSMTVEEKETVHILSALENGKCDMAFMRGEMLDESYEKIPLKKDRLAAVLPINHPLAALSSVPLCRLQKEPFLLLDQGTLLYDSCLKACGQAGFTPNVTYTGTRMETIAELVSQGMGVSLMMEQAVSYLRNSKVAILPLEDGIISHISLVRPKRRAMSPAARTFWDFVEAISHNPPLKIPLS